MDYSDRQTEFLARKIEELTTRKVEEKFTERLNSEIRNAVRAELERMFITMKEMIHG